MMRVFLCMSIHLDTLAIMLLSSTTTQGMHVFISYTSSYTINFVYKSEVLETSKEFVSYATTTTGKKIKALIMTGNIVQKPFTRFNCTPNYTTVQSYTEQRSRMDEQDTYRNCSFHDVIPKCLPNSWQKLSIQPHMSVMAV